MSNFGSTLFSGSPFVRWTLTPFIVLFAVSMPLLIRSSSVASMALLAGMELVCLALLAGFWLPSRFGQHAYRGVAGMVFLAYAAYLAAELLFGNQPLRLMDNPGNASPRNALLGFFMIGVPGMWYALFGRFTLRPN